MVGLAISSDSSVILGFSCLRLWCTALKERSRKQVVQLGPACHYLDGLLHCLQRDKGMRLRYITVMKALAADSMLLNRGMELHCNHSMLGCHGWHVND